jgi:hypothetical protein
VNGVVNIITRQYPLASEKAPSTRAAKHVAADKLPTRVLHCYAL